MDQTKVLHFRPCAGLANRIRALVSALVAAEDIGWKLHVWWPLEPGITSAPFSAIFDVERSLPPHVLSLEEEWHTAPEILVKNDPEWQIIAKRLTGGGGFTKIPPFLKSYHQFHTGDPTRWLRYLRGLTPHPQHLEAVRNCLEPARGKNAGPLIGIHIRRTDHAQSIKASPTQQFISEMLKLRLCKPNTYFFVASDDDVERKALQKIFGKKILTLATRLDRTSVEGGIDAFLDFLALSQCQEIWGSAYSSFCEVAAQYGGVPYQQIGAIQLAIAQPSTPILEPRRIVSVPPSHPL